MLVVGASNSGEDLCREISEVADRVLICARSWKNAAWASDGTPFGPRHNIERRGMVTRLTKDGSAEFASGAPVARVDAVVYATGYRYDFPFLEGTGVLEAPGSSSNGVLANGSSGGGGGNGGGSDAGGRGGLRRRLSTREQHVAPLYAHMFYPPLAPTLSLIGVSGLNGVEGSDLQCKGGFA